MTPLRFVTFSAAAWLACATTPAFATAPVPDAWAQSAQEKAAAQTAAEAARAASEAARASAQAARDSVRDTMREVERQRMQADRDMRGETFGDKLQKVLKVPEGPTVLVHSFSGNITVSTGPAGEVRVEATKRTSGHGSDQADAKAAADNTRVLIEERSGRVEVKAWSPRGPSRVAVDFDVVVPASATVELKSLSGDIAVTGVKGGVSADSMSGDITANSLAGTSSLRTVSGNVVVNSSAGSGDFSANSISGDVTAKGLKARFVTFGSVSGNVAMQNASCERATVKSVSGNVEIGGALPKSARYELKSHSGDVRVVVDGKTGFEVDVTTWSGAIVNDFGIKNAAPQASREVPGFQQKTLQGVFGDGSAQIEAASFSGNVSIVKAK
jgi:hypothetical protein